MSGTGTFDTKELLSEARRLGCDVRRKRRGGHYRIRTPEGSVVCVAATPGDYRTVRNEIARLRRLGVPMFREEGER